MALTPVNLMGKKVLITGPTGQVGQPIVAHYAREAEVWALARFNKQEDRIRMESLGARTVKADLAERESLSACPDDFDYVINLSVTKTGDFVNDLAANAEGVGNLMMRCRKTKGFLHFSSTAVYQYEGQTPRKETDPLGDNHRSMFPTYSIAKIAAETICRFVAHQFGIPTTIARLSVPYGDTGGWPFFHLLMMREGIPIDVHPERPNHYNPIHMDDCIAKIPYLLGAATPAATTVNFGGSQAVSIEQWCTYLGELTGLVPRFRDNPKAFGSLAIDTTR
ncbi:MAG: NAD(P)-dependent oxidoreductase, partial [Chloroflexi bacterium]|nr:NAD(P)-dependent oxidoreductase [Chloroflexota bacterium]